MSGPQNPSRDSARSIASFLGLGVQHIATGWDHLAFVLAQLGRDVFDGDGWEAYDHNKKNPPAPAGQAGA